MAMKKLVALIGLALMCSTLVALLSTPASAAKTIITCTDQSNQSSIALKATQKNCKQLQAPALWQIQESDSWARTGAGYANLRICSSKNPAFSYQRIKASCNKNQVTTDYWRVISAPETPAIEGVSALGHNGAVVTFGPLSSATNISTAIAYYLVTNIKTGQVSKIAPNDSSQIYIYDLNPLTSYTFEIVAVGIDGTSVASAITHVITTGAAPITTAPLAAPAFTLSSVSEIRTANTVATGFSVTSTGGAIANFAISPAAPAGMSFNTATGAFTGTPTTVAGATTYTITATNGSGSASRTFTLTVTAGVVIYAVGDRGPGGGIVYYVSASNFTSTGSTCSTACKYLEVAPATWKTGSVADDLTHAWSSNTSVLTGQDITTAGTESGFANEKFNWKIGQGFYNTSVMKVSGATSVAQAAVLSFAATDSSAGQWFLPSMNELNELCKYARGQSTGNPTVACVTGTGTFKSTANAGSDLGGFVLSQYWSSSENDAFGARFQSFSSGVQNATGKVNAAYVRPVRAF